MKKTRARGIDLIRDGVSKEDLRRTGSRAVFSALVSTAMSWQNRGWTYEMWASALRGPQNQLWHQTQVDHRKKSRTMNAVTADLKKAWKIARTNVAERPSLTRSDISSTARMRLEQLDSLEEGDWPIDDRALLVLRHVLGTAAELGTMRPALPVREAMKASGLPSTMAAHRALGRLEARDFIRCVERGRPGRGKSSGRASLFVWDTPALARLLTSTSQCPYGAMSNTNAESSLDMSNGGPRADRNAAPDMSNGGSPQAGDALPDRSSGDSVSMSEDAPEMSNAKNTEYASESITIRLDGGEIATVMIPDGKEARDQVLNLLKANGAEIETNQNELPPIAPLRLVN